MPKKISTKKKVPVKKVIQQKPVTKAVKQALYRRRGR